MRNTIFGCMSGCVRLIRNSSFSTKRWKMIWYIFHSFTHVSSTIKRWFPAGIHHFFREFVYRLYDVAFHGHNHCSCRAAVEVHSKVCMFLISCDWHVLPVNSFHILNEFFTFSLFLCDTSISSTCHTTVSRPLLVHLFATQGLYGFMTNPYYLSSFDNFM